MNRDFVEMLSALSEAGVEYLVVGAHAMAAHGHPRATGDLDVWVRANRENGQRVPSRADILSGVSGVRFDEAWPRHRTITVESLSVPVIGLEDLIRNKRATGRPQDLLDADRLDADARRSPEP